MKQQFTSRVLSAMPFLGMNDRVRYRLHLSCGHVVSRAEVKDTARCEVCATQTTSNERDGELPATPNPKVHHGAYKQDGTLA